MKRAVLAIALACAGACTAPVEPPPGSCPTPKLEPGNPPIVPAGQPVAIEMSFGTTCSPPTAIEVSVLGPDNLPVPATGSLDAYLATVRFTPAAPGPYHLMARFQPNRGLAQFDVEAAEDRTASPALVLRSFPYACGPLELTEAGLLVCTQTTHSVFAVASGTATVVQEFDGGFPIALASDVLWLGAPLSRWVPGTRADGGPGFVRSPDVGLPLTAKQLFVTPLDAVVQLTDGTFGRASLDPDGGLMWRSYGMKLGVLEKLVKRVGDTLVCIDITQECVLALEDGGLDCDLHVLSEGQTAMDGDATGFWLIRGDRKALQWHGPGHQRSPEIALPPLGWEIGQATAPVTVIHEPPFTLVNRPGGVGFEYWGKLRKLGKRAEVTAKTVVADGDGGTLLIYRR